MATKEKETTLPAVGRGNGQQVQVRATEVERPVAVMPVGALEVRVGARMGLCVQNSVIRVDWSTCVREDTMEGSVYHAPQRRFAIRGACQEEGVDKVRTTLRISGSAG